MFKFFFRKNKDEKEDKEPDDKNSKDKKNKKNKENLEKEENDAKLILSSLKEMDKDDNKQIAKEAPGFIKK